MKYLYLFRPDSSCASCVPVPDAYTVTEERGVHSTYKDFVLSDHRFELSSVYYLNGEAVPTPPRPSLSHKFNYETKQWEDPSLETLLILNRAKRSALLTMCDWTQLSDVPIETKEAWAPYRQALRDITDQDQTIVVWPIPPGA